MYRYPGLELGDPPSSRILHPARRSPSSSRFHEDRKLTAVRGELFRVTDAVVFQAVDEWEGYDALAPESSPYLRRIVRMVDPEVDAWIYVGNHTDQSNQVTASSWRDHLDSKSSEDGSERS